MALVTKCPQTKAETPGKMHLSLQHTVCILSQGEGKLKMQSKALNVSKLEREGERKEKRKESDRSGRNHFQGSLDH